MRLVPAVLISPMNIACVPCEVSPSRNYLTAGRAATGWKLPMGHPCVKGLMGLQLTLSKIINLTRYRKVRPEAMDEIVKEFEKELGIVKN